MLSKENSEAVESASGRLTNATEMTAKHKSPAKPARLNGGAAAVLLGFGLRRLPSAKNHRPSAAGRARRGSRLHGVNPASDNDHASVAISKAAYRRAPQMFPRQTSTPLAT